MERRIYEASVEGSVESLLSLLHEDALVLDRFMVRCYSETPLHIASMLGHDHFVQEILRRKPELAGELDSRKSSPLHLATAKGHLEIVKLLLSINPDMCFACDRDGKNPLHIASIKGHMNVLRELIQVRPQAARRLMGRSETILHACVLYNQLEAMKFLVEIMNEHEFLNSKDDDGNTILHLAVIDKQVQAVKFLTTSRAIEVNAINENGFTALDMLPPTKLDMKDWKIGELLQYAGARSVKNTPPLTTESGTTQTTSSILTPQDNNKGSKRPKRIGKKQADKRMEKKRNTLMVVASLIAAMAFQAGLNPPGGVWQENYEGDKNDDRSPPHEAGYSITASRNSYAYNRFFACNTTGFVASLSIILLIISSLPCLRNKFFMLILTVIMWIAVSAMTLAYLFAVANLSDLEDSQNTAFEVILFGWSGLMAILFIGHIIRGLVKMLKFIVKLVKRQRQPSNPDAHQPQRGLVKMVKFIIKLVKRQRQPSNPDAHQPQHFV